MPNPLFQNRSRRKPVPSEIGFLSFRGAAKTPALAVTGAHVALPAARPTTRPQPPEKDENGCRIANDIHSYQAPSCRQRGRRRNGESRAARIELPGAPFAKIASAWRAGAFHKG
jgi:hypothetical protein